MGRFCVPAGCRPGFLCRPPGGWCSAEPADSPVLCSLVYRRSGSKVQGFLSLPGLRWQRCQRWRGQRYRLLRRKRKCRKGWVVWSVRLWYHCLSNFSLILRSISLQTTYQIRFENMGTVLHARTKQLCVHTLLVLNGGSTDTALTDSVALLMCQITKIWTQWSTSCLFSCAKVRKEPWFVFSLFFILFCELPCEQYCLKPMNNKQQYWNDWLN